MNKINFFQLLFVFAISIIIVSCGGNKSTDQKVVETKEVTTSEAQILAEYVEANGNFINATDSGITQSFISAKEVNELLGGYIYVIDLRSAKDYSDGHIDGAINVKPENLINHVMNDIVTSDYDKIILACYTGQTAGFATSILRLMGYKNVYDLQWGMCAWNKKFIATKWGDNAKDLNPEMVEITANQKLAAGEMAEINTGLKDGKEILMERANAVLGAGFNPIIVKYDTFLLNPAKYFIVSYVTEEQYNAGHLKGAVLFQPTKSFALAVDLKTLPTDKPILVYSNNGNDGAYLVAYLKMLGYDAYTLLYGANSFMTSKLKEKKWDAFTPEVINNFKFKTSKFVESGDAKAGGGGC